MKGFIEVRYNENEDYLVNLQNVAYIYPTSEQCTTIVFNFSNDSMRVTLRVEHSYAELKAKINAALE